MIWFESVKKAQAVLSAAGIEEAANDARLLLEHCLNVNRTWYFMHMRDQADEAEFAAYMELIQRRAQRIPLQYLTGNQEFMGLPFHVNEYTLVPRQDTETLVEQTLPYIKEESRILDMCTGSGCILISLLYLAAGRQIERVEGLGADISEGALAVAKENAADNGVKADFVCSDLFENISGTYDIIVSNPPYIPTDRIKDLMPEVAVCEPVTALDGKEDGLYFYRQIVSAAPSYLKASGVLLFEIGYDQGKDVADMLTNHGFKNVRIVKDLAENDRVVIGEL